MTATLPTQPSGLRIRLWRALKTTGAGTLREGVYVLPVHAPSTKALQDLERTIAEAGAQAHRLVVPARGRIRKSSEVEWHKTLRVLQRQLQTPLQTPQSSDFFPGPGPREGRMHPGCAAAGGPTASGARRARLDGGRDPATRMGRLPGSDLGNAQASLGRSPRNGLADPPLHRPQAQSLHTGEDDLLAASIPAFDACYAALKLPHER